MTSQTFRQRLRVLSFATAILACHATSTRAQTSDTTPPHLVTIAFTPAVIDVTSSPQSVTVTASVTDDLSGTASIAVQFVSPSGSQSEPFNSLFLGRISGTALNGVFRGQLQMPRFSEAGIWKLRVTTLSDGAGNTTSLTAANLQSLGLPTDLTVTSIPDTRPPAVTSIAFSPANIDVSAGSRNITLDLTLTDDVSGVDFSANRFLEFRMTFRSPSGRQQQYSSAPDFQLVSGNALTGAWRVVHAFPQFSEPGIWTIASLNLIDVAGNQVNLNTAALQGLGLPATFTVFSAPADTTPPQVTSFAFTPTVIDTSAGSALVTVTMTISDDLSGTDFSGDGSNVTLLHGAQFVSPSGLQVRNTGAFTRTGGTTLNGTWQSTIFFPQFSEAGTWLATLFGIKDVVHNTSNLSTAALVSNGFPTQLVIFQPSQAPDGTVGSSGGTVTDSVFGARATIMFPPGTLPNSTSVAIDVLGTSLGLPTPQGFSGGTLFVNVNLSPTPPMPFGAPGLTVTLPIATFRTPGSLINLYRLDPTTGLLVPAISVTNTNVVGTVNPDGLSATFSGVSHLSTLVGFFPTALLGDVNRDGVVTCADLAIVKASFGRRSGQLGFDARADVNSNGVVDINDLALVSRQLPAGTTCQ